MIRPLRVLFITDAFPPHSYGSGWSTYHLARGLRAQGHEVRIVVAAPTFRVAATTYDDFPVWQDRSGTRRVNPAAFSFHGLGPGRIVHRLVRAWSPDIVHAQHINAMLVASHDAGTVPMIVTVRDHWPICFYGTALALAPCPSCLRGTLSLCNPNRGSTNALKSVHLLKREVMRGMLRQRQRILARAGGVIAASAAIRQEIAPLVVPSRLHTIPNAVDLSLFSGDASSRASDLPDRFFLYVGKLAHHKGADLLAEIAAGLGPGAPPVVIVGDGPLEASLRGAADREGLRVLGRLSNEDVIALMQRAIAIVTPARWPEPLSRTHLEALAAGCPIVATDTGGTREVVADGVTGFLTAVADVAAMTLHLRELAANSALRSHMSAASRERAEQLFGLDAITARHLSVYRAAIETGTTRKTPPLS